MNTLKSVILTRLSCLLLFASLGLPLAAEGQQVLDRVLASIEGEPITLSEVTRFAQGQGKQVSANNEEQLRTALQEVVAQKLVEKEAQALSISVSNDEIQAYLEEIQNQNRVDEQTFKTLLKERGIEWESYLKQISTDILKGRIVSARVRSKINVVDEDIARYLVEQPELKPAEGTKRVLQIPLSSDSDIAKSEYGALVEEISKTENLKSRKVLDRGAQDLGYVVEGELRSEIREAISGVTDGEVSEIVSLDLRNVAFFVVGSITADTPVDEMLKQEITGKVFEKKFQEQLRKFLEEDLPKRYHVEQL